MNHPDQLTLPFDLPDTPGAPPALQVPRATDIAPAPLTSCPPLLPQGAKWREVLSGGRPIGFVLQRSKRKTIGLVVGDDGLRITAPKWVTLRQIDDTVLEKSSWILDKLAQHQARQEQLALADTQWRDGGHFPYLGTQIVLVLGSHDGRAAYQGDVMAPQPGDTLRLGLPGDADRNRVRDSAQSWLQQRARAWFGQRLEHFQKVSGRTINRWRLSSAATRWGSCNSDGNIMLNWRLIHFAPPIIDYVIAHEIAHLREMNHGADFWREVGRILPGFEAARNTLRQHDPATLPLL
ncbi:MAG TPA: SprT family zinc-dependent metalloprotease [Burkholderiaceae bacterium]|nr:SprT family zinc-dependent metalloprotease [Burkholderiaceae bacterium]